MSKENIELSTYPISIGLCGTLKSMSYIDPILQEALVDTLVEVGEVWRVKKAFVGISEVYLESEWRLDLLPFFNQQFAVTFHRNLWSKIAKEEYSIVYVDDSPYHSHASISAENMYRLPIIAIGVRKVWAMDFKDCQILNVELCEYLHYWKLTDPKPVPVFGRDRRLPNNSKFERQDLTKVFQPQQLKGIVIDFLPDEPTIKNYE